MLPPVAIAAHEPPPYTPPTSAAHRASVALWALLLLWDAHGRAGVAEAGEGSEVVKHLCTRAEGPVVQRSRECIGREDASWLEVEVKSTGALV